MNKKDAVSAARVTMSYGYYDTTLTRERAINEAMREKKDLQSIWPSLPEATTYVTCSECYPRYDVKHPLVGGKPDFKGLEDALVEHLMEQH